MASWRSRPERRELRLFEHASGELTELYEEDWRTTPLLQCPSMELRPGEMTARAANELAQVRKVDPL